MAQVKNARGGAAAASAAPGAEDDVASLAETVDVSYGNGHVLTLKRPGVLSGFRLVRMLDPEVARNTAYVDMLGSLLYAHKIDGEFVPFPQSEREIEGLITRLGEDGMSALFAGLMERWGKPNAEADKEAIRN